MNPFITLAPHAGAARRSLNASACVRRPRRGMTTSIVPIIELDRRDLQGAKRLGEGGCAVRLCGGGIFESAALLKQALARLTVDLEVSVRRSPSCQLFSSPG